jgi:hypothetical protein
MRLAAAQKIRDYVRHVESDLPDAMLEALHRMLFDSCPEVRYAVAEALFYGGTAFSLPFLEVLQEVEQSVAIRATAERALLRIEYPRCKRPAVNQLLLASDDTGLGMTLLEWCKVHQKVLCYAERESPDVIGIPCFATAVDLTYVGEPMWDTY